MEIAESSTDSLVDFGNKTRKTLGDPDSVDLTEYCQNQGWHPPARTEWTPLPWVIVKEGEALLPVDPFRNGEVLPHEIVISHPEFPATQDLGLRWYAIPILSDMALKIGGIVYPLAPFNGHYLGTEIAARNLIDPDDSTSWNHGARLQH